VCGVEAVLAGQLGKRGGDSGGHLNSLDSCVFNYRYSIADG
jgi:hypothetical protein